LIRYLALAALLFTAPFLAYAADNFPALTGRVVDEAGVLPPAAKGRLTAELAAHEQRTGQQVVVAVVKSLGGQPIEDYGVALGRAWGIGQKGGNTGAILLVSPADRRVRIEVGYGLEGELTDAISATIISQMIIPRFKQGDMAGGIVAGTEQILRTLGDNITATPPPPVRVQQKQPEGHGSIGSIILTFLVFGIFMWMARRRGGMGGGGIGSAILPFMIFSSFGGRGGSSGGGDGGGGFSGGGGSFGGGGASGSW
jgi:uncharacterized protein